MKARQCLALVSMAFLPMRAMETRAKQLTENDKLLREDFKKKMYILSRVLPPPLIHHQQS